MAQSSVRKAAVVKKEQTAVWSEVKNANTKAGNVTATDSYNSFEDNKDYKKKEKAYIDYFKTKLKGKDKLVGLLAVTGDKVFAADIFASENILKDRLDLLLPSYINEAIVDGEKVSIKNNAVQDYLTKLLSKDKQEDFLKENGSNYKIKNKSIHISSY